MVLIKMHNMAANLKLHGNWGCYVLFINVFWPGWGTILAGFVQKGPNTLQWNAAIIGLV